jgi:histidinol phosphatase-like enzyme (inositol monophosphatase family)
MAAPDVSGLRPRLELAVTLAREAGELTLHYYQDADLAIITKSDFTPVTAADRSAEELIRAGILRAMPEDGVVGEEFGETPGRNAWRWWLDPVDGTQSFVRGVPLYGTMIGLEHDGAALAGVVFFPALAELYWAGRGLGSWWAPRLPSLAEAPGQPAAPRRARVSSVETLASARFNTTSGKGWEAERMGDTYRRLLDATATDRTWGDCYGHVLVATGRADVMIDPVMNDWDCAPLLPIVEEAGGRFTDLAGNATIHGKSAVSTNGVLHEAVLELVGRRG